MADLMREGHALNVPADGAYNIPPAAGRELDALVAEKVMGYRRAAVPADAHGKNAGITLVPAAFDERNYAWAPLGEYGLAAFVPHYSTGIADAWLVVEKIQARGLDVELQTLAKYSHQWRCCVGSGKECWHIYRTEETAPLAIVRAALAATAP